ncbi:hypothetical protein VNI00_006793 [Paramarasmius palmivorus]|uniref:Uncharacterized protein n=1 Tax=Paramarasmius palmivorus TaxID=297713 RepID=A0AAW0D855_9AGAR
MFKSTQSIMKNSSNAPKAYTLSEESIRQLEEAKKVYRDEFKQRNPHGVKLSQLSNSCQTELRTLRAQAANRLLELSCLKDDMGKTTENRDNWHKSLTKRLERHHDKWAEEIRKLANTSSTTSNPSPPLDPAPNTTIKAPNKKVMNKIVNKILGISSGRNLFSEEMSKDVDSRAKVIQTMDGMPDEFVAARSIALSELWHCLKPHEQQEWNDKAKSEVHDLPPELLEGILRGTLDLLGPAVMTLIFAKVNNEGQPQAFVMDLSSLDDRFKISNAIQARLAESSICAIANRVAVDMFEELNSRKSHALRFDRNVDEFDMELPEGCAVVYNFFQEVWGSDDIPWDEIDRYYDHTLWDFPRGLHDPRQCKTWPELMDIVNCLKASASPFSFTFQDNPQPSFSDLIPRFTHNPTPETSTAKKALECIKEYILSLWRHFSADMPLPSETFHGYHDTKRWPFPGGGSLSRPDHLRKWEDLQQFIHFFKLHSGPDAQDPFHFIHITPSHQLPTFDNSDLSSSQPPQDEISPERQSLPRGSQTPLLQGSVSPPSSRPPEEVHQMPPSWPQLSPLPLSQPSLEKSSRVSPPSQDDTFRERPPLPQGLEASQVLPLLPPTCGERPPLPPVSQGSQEMPPPPTFPSPPSRDESFRDQPPLPRVSQVSRGEASRVPPPPPLTSRDDMSREQLPLPQVSQGSRDKGPREMPPPRSSPSPPSREDSFRDQPPMPQVSRVARGEASRVSPPPPPPTPLSPQCRDDGSQKLPLLRHGSLSPLSRVSMPSPLASLSSQPPYLRQGSPSPPSSQSQGSRDPSFSPPTSPSPQPEGNLSQVLSDTHRNSLSRPSHNLPKENQNRLVIRLPTRKAPSIVANNSPAPDDQDSESELFDRGTYVGHLILDGQGDQDENEESDESDVAHDGPETSLPAKRRRTAERPEPAKRTKRNAEHDTIIAPANRTTGTSAVYRHASARYVDTHSPPAKKEFKAEILDGKRRCHGRRRDEDP